MGFLRGGTNASNPPNYVGMQIQTSSEGMVLPVVYGVNTVAPNLVWADNFRNYGGSGKKGGGKGGGKGSSAPAYFCGVIMAACEGPITYGVIYVDQTTLTTDAALNLTPYFGTTTQTPFDCISTNPAFVPIAYRDVAYLASNSYSLGSAATLPQHNFEIQGFLAGGGTVNVYDANPADILYDICTNTRYGLGMPPALMGDFGLYRSYCCALGLMLSPVLDKQEQAISILQRWAQLTNSWIFWSENQIKVVPLGDAVVVGYGNTFTPNNEVQYALTYDDFAVEENSSDPPLTVTRLEPSKAYNWVKLDTRDRSNSYSTATVEYKDETSIRAYGTFQANSVSADEICDRGIASVIVGLIGARAFYIRNSYRFSLSYNFVLLEPGDIVTLTDPSLGLDAWPVRIRTMQENDKGSLDFEAEECPSGTGTAIVMGNQTSMATTLPSALVDPGAVNAPLLFEPPLVLTAGTPQVWIGASGASSYWGGATVHLSVDDVTYINVGQITMRTAQGVLLADLPSHADPDTTDTLSIDLTESVVNLTSSVTHADADANRTLALVGSEVLSYGAVTPNGTDAYASDLSYLRRGQYATTIADHPTGTAFSSIVASAMLQLDLPAAYVGVTFYAKFTSFNIFGGAEEDISTVTRYTYTPTGVGYTIAAPTSPALALSTPSGATSISMTFTWTGSIGPSLASNEVQISADGGATWTAADVTLGASAVSYTFASALASTSYQARVRAISAGALAASSWATSAVVNSGAAPTIPGGSTILSLVNGDLPIGIITDPSGVPVYVDLSAPAAPVGTGRFRVSAGTILAPDGSVFVARGVAFDASDMASVVTGSACLPLLTLFPGLNYVRVAVQLSDDAGGAYDFSLYPPSAFTSLVSDLTAKGIVVNIENHAFPQSNSVQTGSQLTAEAAWYAALATAFLDNTYVWFSTPNEPVVGGGSGSQAAVSTEHVAVYNAIRGTGSSAIILIDLIGGGVSGYLGTSPAYGYGLTASAYTTMTNVGWDLHQYAGTTTSGFAGLLASSVALAQQITSGDGVMPVLIGEYGNSEDATSVDTGWIGLCVAVQSSGYGCCAWIWGGSGGDVDILVNSGSLTDYGTQVAGWIAS